MAQKEKRISGQRILFIQHAGTLGGSAYSLLLLMRGLSAQGFQPEVALIRSNDQMRKLYVDEGFTVYNVSGIEIFAHTTGGWGRLNSWSSIKQLIITLCKWRSTQNATLRLVDTVKPDIVHLNSVVLSPSAIALRRRSIPYVWHIRECPPFQGMRTQFIRQQLLASPHVIFLSAYDQMAWVDCKHGEVIPNFVDFAKINAAPERAIARKQLGIELERPVVLYLGGTVAIKGFFILLKAITQVLKERPDTLFLMPGSEIRLARQGWKQLIQRILPHVGLGTPGQKVLRYIRREIGENSVRLLPFTTDVMGFLSACNLVVFPSISPHFARPVIEAAAMGRPVIGSNIGGVKELVEQDITGILIPPGEPGILAENILQMLNQPHVVAKMGIEGKKLAYERYTADLGVSRIATIYQKLLAD